MAASLNLKTPAALTVARPALRKGGLIRPGTKFSFDFTDPRCHPGGVITPGPLAAGAVFTDLAAGVTAVVLEASWSVNADGSIVLAYDGNSMNIGAPGQFDLAALAHETVAVTWVKKTGTIGGNALLLFYGASSGNDAQVYLATDPNGNLLAGASGFYAPDGQPVSPAVQQVASLYKPGTSLRLARDGAITETQGDAGAPTPAPNATMRFGAGAAVTLYALSYHDITASLAAEAALGLPVTERLSASQHVARDHAWFGGTFTGAPRAAFA